MTITEYNLIENNGIQDILKNLSDVPWKYGIYKLQSWGNWLHKIAPYVGRITPSFAHWLIRICTEKNETILDPFCGIGTIPLEANLLYRQSVGFDLNPYAYCIAQSKMDRRPLTEHIKYLTNIKFGTEDIDLSLVPEWVKNYYNEKTLKEILSLKKIFENDEQYFLLGCLIGISQGHRPGHLSKPCAWTLPYKPRDDDPGEYREVIPRLIEKIKRTYKNGFDSYPIGKIYLDDARNMPLHDNSIDTVISSPPYFSTIDYINSSRLRLAILGYYDNDRKKLREPLIQKSVSYLKEMESVILDIRRVLKPGGKCILILGDWHQKDRTIKTAFEIKKIMEKHNFMVHGITEDEIPFGKSVQRNDKTSRFDRILVSTNDK